MSTENERLRALLADAREWTAHGSHVRARIDAALAAPMEGCPRCEETEHAMHLRIRAGYDKTVADSWRAHAAKIERERDEARAEVERLRDDVRSTNDALDFVNARMDRRVDEARNLARKEARAEVVAAFRRGAEAMREAAIRAVSYDEYADLIRALPLPKETP